MKFGTDFQRLRKWPNIAINFSVVVKIKVHGQNRRTKNLEIVTARSRFKIHVYSPNFVTQHKPNRSTLGTKYEFPKKKSKRRPASQRFNTLWALSSLFIVFYAVDVD